MSKTAFGRQRSQVRLLSLRPTNSQDNQSVTSLPQGGEGQCAKGALTPTTHIYVVVAGAHCKVGIAKDPVRRLRKLQNGNPIKLTLAHSIVVPTDAAAMIESEAHGMLGALQTSAQNEWFKVKRLAAIKAVVQAARNILGLPKGAAVPFGPCGKYARPLTSSSEVAA